MAIYHMQAKVVSRGSGRSAVAASAYMSCSRMYNDYDGIQHDYTRKHGLIYQEVLLPPMASPEWKDREQLWNAVEAAEKTKDSRLAREFVVALPVELDKDSNISLLKDFIQKNFVDMGMCADFAIHDTDGHNPHAHILLTVRPLNENGTWQYKTKKEYLCIKNGEEKGFTATEFKAAQKDGWEKQYRYKVGKKKIYMTASDAHNPHAIVFMNGVKDLDIEKIGPKFENHERFPQRINTEFARVIDRKTVEMRVWERGSGETLACGTGACAVAVASILNGYTEREVEIRLLGGNLQIEWNEEDNHVYMTGPATVVFDGEIEL